MNTYQTWTNIVVNEINLVLKKTQSIIQHLIKYLTSSDNIDFVPD